MTSGQELAQLTIHAYKGGAEAFCQSGAKSVAYIVGTQYLEIGIIELGQS